MMVLSGCFPIGKVRGSNGDLIRHSRLHVMKLERIIFRCSDSTAISGPNVFQLNRGVGYGVAIGVDCRPDDDCRLQLWFWILSKQRHRNC